MHISRRTFMEAVTLATVGAAVGCATAPKREQEAMTEPAMQRPNVLFIAVDDLRPMMACYGVPFIQTPNIDRLAAQGMVFQHAYCQDAVCSPTRTSLLTGLRPDSTHIFDNGTDFRVYHPDLVTLPQHFKNNGYESLSFGKIYHSCFERAYVGRTLEDRFSWSRPPWFPSPQHYHTPEGIRIAREVFARNPDCGRDENGGGGCMHTKLDPVAPNADRSEVVLDQWTDHFVMASLTEAPDVPDEVPYDGQVAQKAIGALRSMPPGQPFFLAVGFMKPHVPYVAPKRYWDLYDRAELPLAPNPDAPVDMPPIALDINHDHGVYVDQKMEGPLTEDEARLHIHGYAACVSYVDALVGRLLDALDETGHADDTIVVLWGDHGFHLGENSRWGKQTCFETATRSPLIVSAPAMRARGQHTQRLVEFVDIYPSLCELARLPLPEHLEGRSFVPLLDDPERPWKAAAFSQFPRPVRVSTPDMQPQPGDCMGYSMRTERYRYTVWQEILDPTKNQGEELYDYVRDPLERENLIDRPAYRPVAEDLRRRVREGWRAALPK